MEDTKRKLIAELEKLSNEDFIEVVNEAVNKRGIEVQRTLSKRLSKAFLRHAKNGSWTGVSNDSQPLECPEQLPVQVSSSSKPAVKSPFIYQGNLVPEDGLLFFDVEKLSLKLDSTAGKHVQAASSVAIVNEEKKLIFWSFVKWEEAKICQTFPGLTGITRDKLQIGQPIEYVTHFANLCFNNNIIVGYDMKNDLECFNATAGKQDDLAEYFVDNKNQKYSLKDLCKNFFGDENFQCGIHSAIQDARKTRDLYFKKVELVKEYPDFREYPGTVVRSPKVPYDQEKNDRCCCPKKGNPSSWGPKKRNRGNHYYLPE